MESDYKETWRRTRTTGCVATSNIPRLSLNAFGCFHPYLEEEPDFDRWHTTHWGGNILSSKKLPLGLL